MANETAVAGRQTALVTGASSGIGLELARLFAAGGYDLVLVARSGGRLEELAGELRTQAGIAVRAMAADLARPESPEELSRELEQAGIAVDVLVNNAGFGTFGPFAGTDLHAELEELQLNVVTLTHLTKKRDPPDALGARHPRRPRHAGSPELIRRIRQICRIRRVPRGALR